MPQLTSEISLGVKLLMLLILPLNIMWCSFLTVACLPKEYNGFKTPQICAQLSKNKNAAISRDVPQELLQKKARQMGGSLNDLVMTVLSLSLKQYLERYTDDTHSRTIQLAVPFSLRPKP